MSEKLKLMLLYIDASIEFIVFSSKKKQKTPEEENVFPWKLGKPTKEDYDKVNFNIYIRFLCQLFSVLK